MKGFHEIAMAEMRRVEGGWGLGRLWKGVKKVGRKGFGAVTGLGSRIAYRIPGPGRILKAVRTMPTILFNPAGYLTYKTFGF
jgi:hypothetical protein